MGGGEDRRRRESDDASGAPTPDAGSARRRDRRGSIPWLPIIAATLLLAVLVAGVLLWRSLGESLSGTSTARDSIDSGPQPKVRLINGAGQVRVEGVRDLGAVEYEVTKHALASDPATAKQRASDVSVDLTREDSTFVLETGGGRNTGADYVVRIPARGSVEVEAEAGDVEVSSLSGDLTVYAGAGDVTVRDVGGSVGIEAPQGDVVLSGMSTDTGSAEIEVGSGDVTLEDLVVGTLEASVEAGDVTISGRFSGGGRVSVETGDVIAEIPQEDTRELTLNANVGEVLRDGETGAGGN